jgi:hypothetical protein
MMRLRASDNGQCLFVDIKRCFETSPCQHLITLESLTGETILSEKWTSGDIHQWGKTHRATFKHSLRPWYRHFREGYRNKVKREST